MSSKLLLKGTLFGIVLVIASLEPLFSAQAATPEQIQWQNSLHHPGINHTMFTAIGMTMVQDVRISGVNITGDNEVSVNLI